MDEKTVRVEVIEGFSALKMIWDTRPLERDVARAFVEITRYLDKVDETVNVIVDITSAPKFPITTTYSGVMSGPFNHSKMGKWLVVGSNIGAQIIAKMMNAVGSGGEIIWFENEEAAMAALAELAEGE